MDDIDNDIPVDKEEQEQQTKEPQEQENHINDIVKKQMEQFQTTFMEQFQEQFNDKINNFENDKQEFENVKRKHQIKELLMQNNLESELLDYVYNDDMEVAKLKIEQLNKIINSRVEKAVRDKFKEYSYVPPSSNTPFDNVNFDKPPYMV